MSDPVSDWADDAVRLCSELIRLDGQLGSSDERAGAEYVAGLLSAVGVEATLLEPEPRRTSLVARIPGADSTLDPLLIHTHLDVVPADASEWSVDPLSG